MLGRIIERYLEISHEKSIKLIKLLSLERRWQEEVEWDGKTYKLSDVKTQADFIGFLQAIGQTHWFNGHDRAAFADNINDNNADIESKYYKLFEAMGMTQATHLASAPTFSVITGSCEQLVKAQVARLNEDMQDDLKPTASRVYGLGCNRPLNTSPAFNEADSVSKLRACRATPTEMNMVSLITRQALYGSRLTYEEVNTSSLATLRSDKKCVKTTDTALSLRKAIELKYGPPSEDKLIKMAIYTCQPFTLRQQRDIQKILGTGYLAQGVGPGVTLEMFREQPKSIAIFLGELARLININYTPANLEKLNVPLSSFQLNELERLTTHNTLKDVNRLFKKSSFDAIKDAPEITTQFELK